MQACKSFHSVLGFLREFFGYFVENVKKIYFGISQFLGGGYQDKSFFFQVFEELYGEILIKKNSPVC